MSNDEESHDDVLALIERLRTEAGSLMLGSTVPIYGVQDNDLKLDRTGILLRIDRSHFLVTAAHDLDKICQLDIPLYADLDPTTRTVIPLQKQHVLATEYEGHGSRDIAAIELSDEVADKFSSKRFITLAEIDLCPRKDTCLYAAMGFPHEWFSLKGVTRFDVLPYCSSQEESPDSDGFDPEVHIAISLDREPVRIDDQGGEETMKMPRVHGMSGCGIWRISPPLPFDFKKWSASKVRLVAIQHSAKAGSFMRGTWIGHAIARIIDSKPELRKATKLKYPVGF